MHVVEPRSVPAPAAFRAATEKYSGQVRLTPDGHLDPATYVAGLPFPVVDERDPQAAVRVAYNHRHRPSFADDLERARFGGAVGFLRGDGEARRHDVQAEVVVASHRALRFAGRTEVAPLPELRPGSGRLEMQGRYPYLEPYDLKGFGAVVHRHLDPAREDDAWIYLPSFRRIRRTPETQLSEGLLGRELDPHSIWGFSARVSLFRWKLLGVGPRLGSLQAGAAERACTRRGSLVCGPWEVRPRVWTVEATPLAGSYGYGKRVLHVDGETWEVLASDLFDGGGELWKVIAVEHGDGPGSRLALRRFAMADVRTPHLTLYRYPHPRFPGEPPLRTNRGVDAVGTEAWFAPEALVGGGR